MAWPGRSMPQGWCDGQSWQLLRASTSDARVGMKKRTLRSNQETDEGKRCAALANSLTKKAPYKGLGAESEEKREPASDIDPGVVDGLKVLLLDHLVGAGEQRVRHGE